MKSFLRFAFVFILLIGGAVGAQPVDHAKFLEWHKEMIDAMIKKPLPKERCFTVTYPRKEWAEEPCALPVNLDELFAVAPMVGNSTADDSPAGNPTAEVKSGRISKSIGSFDCVHLKVESTSEDYSLQLNSQEFATPLCKGAVNPDKCQGWQQFVYHPDQYGGFIQYWLLSYGHDCPPKETCPSNCPKGWQPWGSDCYSFSKTRINGQHESISELAHLSVGGTVTGGTDILTVGTARCGKLHVYSQDNILELGADWRGVEFGVFGNGGGAEATLHAGTTIVVRTSVDNKTTDPPDCRTPDRPFTGETNNLKLVPPCSTYGGQAPAIVFRLSNESDASTACAH